MAMFFLIMRNNSLKCFISLALALLLFNYSIDPEDPLPREDLMANEIESFFELWIEVVMNHGDVVQESNEGDDHSGKREVPSTFLIVNGELKLPKSRVPEKTQYNLFSTPNIHSRTTAIVTPPPRNLNV